MGRGDRLRQLVGRQPELYVDVVPGSPESVEEFNEAIAGKLSDDVRLRSAEESSERAYAAADRAQRFLSLTAVISLLLSAVAISISALASCGPPSARRLKSVLRPL